MIINLEQEQKSLEVEIKKLELQILPIQKKLQELRERKFHIDSLLGQKTEISTPQRVNWAEICREHGWIPGGDSSHRVVRRRDPNLHGSIPHKCHYDGRTYP